MAEIKHSTFDPEIQQNLDSWLEGSVDPKIKTQLEAQVENNPQEIIDAFYKKLEFGTGGLRGIVGLGTNRMNGYTVGTATQGLANYLHQQFPGQKEIKVIIGYDSRTHSREFAEKAARVLAGNQIKAYVFKELRPTPLVSYGCRKKGCQAAIVITASHNPPEYNGYKVYWADGGQIVPPHDKKIIEQVSLIDNFDLIKEASLDSPFIEWVGDEIDESYYQDMTTLQSYPEQNRSQGGQLKIIYSSLHGTGITLLPKLLKAWGFDDLELVEEQCVPDGNFSTVDSPNPEEASALKLGVSQMERNQGDLLLATDPDADRVGIAIRHEGETVLLTGNQIACLCLDHICQALSEKGKLPANAAFVKTIVTTELFRLISESYGSKCYDVLTGFKYIAELIEKWDQEGEDRQSFIFGGEESYGYLLGTFARDKDAVISSALLCEVALDAKLKGKTLLDQLYDIYQRFGVYREGLVSLKFPDTKEGRESIKRSMEKLRSETPRIFDGIEVVSVEDYSTSRRRFLTDNREETIDLPKSNVLALKLADESKIVVRPSGTEPKVKIYVGVKEKSRDLLPQAVEAADEKVSQLLNSMSRHLEKQ